ncbi:class I adenylate-forming enzyme family protein [Falsiroseomonas selenitidurans]|uniref:AMP-binding protein n=1 Tax=Falsiroseomonas selenitidurans TaxID=2716335 RepID=A0ABX1E1Q6_9PROT|nr:AMP-binding protein [Falsiroseomonas selenitidurans]NKC30630.1 AMP-binding protein [Falsiroseomonas selenitidurans]
MNWTTRLGDLLDANAATRGAEEALVAEGVRHSHAALRAAARGVARGLLALGVRRGDFVGLLMGNDANWVAGFYGAALIGAVTVPVNTRFKPPEIAFALGRARCQVVLLAGRFLNIDFAAAVDSVRGDLPDLRHVVVAGTPGWDAFLAQGVEEAALDAAMAAVASEDVLLVQYTSGTTAHPKGVLLTHHNMLRNATACAAKLGVRPDDRYLNCRPFFHVAGSTLSLLVCLATGAVMVTPQTFEAGAALDLLERERCTLTSGNDAIFQLLMSHPRFDRARLHLRGGWAAAGPETMRRIVEEMGVPDLCWAYGLSEASPNVALSDHREAVADRIAGGAVPHEGLAVRIADPATNAALPPGMAGEIQVQGWSIMRGYLHDPENSAKAFTPDGFLRTGDLGTQDADGRLRMVGRIKDVIRVGGENVAPAEVEEVLSAHPAVALAQVVGVPDARLVEVVAAFVQLRDGARVTEAELLAWLKPQLANFRLPRHLRIVPGFDSIGMTASGKVQKVKLRAHALEVLGLGS